MLLMGIAAFALGVLVYRSNRSSWANRHFLILCISISVWLDATALALSTDRPDLARAWFTIDNLGVMYISVAFYAFTAHFLNLARPRAILIGYGLATVFAAALLVTDSFIIGVSTYWWGYYPRWGWLSLLFFPVFFTFMAAAFVDYVQAYRRVASPIKRQQIRYVFAAFLIAYTGSVDFLPTFGIEIYPFGYIPIFLLVTVITYAILRYRLLDVSFVLYKVLAYLSLLPLYLGILSVIWVATGSLAYFPAGVLVVAFAVFAEPFVRLQGRMQQAVARTLFRRRYDSYRTVQQFSQAAVSILELETLAKEIIHTLATVLGIRRLSLFLLDKDKDGYDVRICEGVDDAALRAVAIGGPLDPFAQYLLHVNHPVVKEELEHGQPAVPPVSLVLDVLARLGSELCLPLVNKERLVGFVNLGHKPHLQMYSQQDLDLLLSLAHNAAIALDNAMLYEDLKRSQLLIRRADRLRSLETIAGGFAHEIRNPLTSIKTFVQLVPDRRDDGDFITGFGQVVAEDVNRIERLIKEILDYARYMQPKCTEEDLNEIVASCLYFLEVKATGKRITVHRDLQPGLSRVVLDRQQIKQVILNLCLNAFDAMEGTGGRLTVRTRQVAKSSGDPWVQLEVQDTGCGIPAGDLEHIFDPFFTTKHESAEREGTGLGLTIVHQIVHDHGGTIEVRSQEGQGTTFVVNLPLRAVSAALPALAANKEAS